MQKMEILKISGKKFKDIFLIMHFSKLIGKIQIRTVKFKIL